MRLRSRDVRRSEGCLHSCATKGTVQAAFLVSATFTGRSPLGARASSASTPVRRRLPLAAAPAAMAGLAAAFALGNAPAAVAATVDASGHHTAASAANAAQVGVSAELLVSITGQQATGPVLRLDAAQAAAMQPKGKHHRTASAKYVVKSGDTLASIAQRLYRSSDYWPVLYWANHAVITYANEIQAGQVLTVPAKPAKIPGAPTALAPVQAPTTSTASSASSAASDPPASTPTAAPVPRPRRARTPAAPARSRRASSPPSPAATRR